MADPNMWSTTLGEEKRKKKSKQGQSHATSQLPMHKTKKTEYN